MFQCAEKLSYPRSPLGSVGPRTTPHLNFSPICWAVLLTETALVAVLPIRPEESRFFAAAERYQPLVPFAVGLLVLAATSVIHANEFLAAFAAGVTAATLSDRLREAFREFGELVTELLKLAGVLVFGALISPGFLGETPAGGYLFAGLALLLARPVAPGVALLGSGLTWRERAVAAWFGPRGFASVFYGLLVLRAGITRGDELFHLAAVVIAGSIVLHSSTDVLVERLFRQAKEAGNIKLATSQEPGRQPPADPGGEFQPE
jgi:NhaP-type Na+/H+ or K+/H+ antiporter